MADLERDSVVNVIHRGIKEPIRLLLDKGYLVAALKLIYSGIDTMAYLGLPLSQGEVQADDFIGWCDVHFRLPGNEQLTGEELYGARCGLLHTHSAASRLSRQGRCRMVFYADDMSPPVKYAPSIATDQVFVSIQAIGEAFFAGVDHFLVDIFKDRQRGRVADDRLKNMLHILPHEAGDVTA